jgi:uncharacterized membrane protein
VAKFVQVFIADRRQLLMVGALTLASCLCLGLLIIRILYTHSTGFVGLFWNLFLAWLPMISALAAFNLRNNHPRTSWAAVLACVLVWLLFFPNAPYILTDIIHLTARPYIPLWYDLITVITFAWTGTFLGLISLYMIQTLVRNALGRWTGWLFALAVLALGSFGVYLGRFPRYNSWDVLADPMSLFTDIWDRLRHPFAYHQTYTFSLVFTLFLVAVYLMLVALIYFGSPHED